MVPLVWRSIWPSLDLGFIFKYAIPLSPHVQRDCHSQEQRNPVWNWSSFTPPLPVYCLLPEVPKFLKEKLKPNRRSCHNCSAGFQMSHLSDAKLHWELSTSPGMKMSATDFATPVLATSRLRSWSLSLSPPFFIHNEIGFKLFAEFLSAYFLSRLPPHCSTRNMLEFKNESSMWLLSS